MHRFAWGLLLLLAGCQSMSLGIAPSPPASAGGGGGPSVQSACPTDAGQALDTAIAGVDDPIAEATLQAQWRQLQALSGAGSADAIDQEWQLFDATCTRLADQGLLSDAQALTLSRLARCYSGAEPYSSPAWRTQARI